MPWRLVSRIAAIFLLALISGDLADASCDPIRLPQDAPDHIASAQDLPDPCADCCVPDCFCCATSLPAAESFTLPGAGAVFGRPMEPAETLIPGVSPLVDHIPLSVS
jgi:hypothetical protein